MSKVMFESETGAMLKVNFFNNNANIDTINGPYTGFLAYPKQVILLIILNEDKKNLFLEMCYRTGGCDRRWYSILEALRLWRLLHASICLQAVR